jgi:hypothetical protein
MKLIKTVILTLLVVSSQAFAHADHGSVGSDGVMDAAKKWVGKLAFRDFGHEAGKLDSSWKQAAEGDYKLLADEDSFYIVQVTNPATGKTIDVKIAKDGRLLAASKAK